MKEVSNPVKAHHHVQLLDEAMSNMLSHVEVVVMVVVVIKDPLCMALRSQTEGTKNLLEDLMPEEDIPKGASIAANVQSTKPLSYDQKDLLVSLFNNLEVTRDKMAWVVGCLSSLFLSPPQLMIILKAMI